ncbi:hypothetical protein WAI453_003340 [Rhynchosporium graminicola]
MNLTQQIHQAGHVRTNRTLAGTRRSLVHSNGRLGEDYEGTGHYGYTLPVFFGYECGLGLKQSTALAWGSQHMGQS